MLVHLEDSATLRFDSHVHQDAEFRVEQSAETFEEESVRVEFACVFMFDTVEDIVVLLAVKGVTHQTAELFLCVLLVPGVIEVVLLHPDRVQNDLVFPRLDISLTEMLHLV